MIEADQPPWCPEFDGQTRVSSWMIGYEDDPDRSAEICICEIFGRNMGAERAGVGMGLHPFGDPRIRDEFSVEDLAIDVRDFHLYAAEWTPEHGLLRRPLPRLPTHRRLAAILNHDPPGD